MPRSFDGFGDDALMFGAGSGGASRNDFAALRDEFVAVFGNRQLLIVYAFGFIHTEDTDFAARLFELAGLAARS